MNPYLHQLMTKKTLSEEASYRLFSELITYPVSEQITILEALKHAEESTSVLLGAKKAMLEQATLIHYPNPVLDIVGTGGDRCGTFNISTASSIVIASCGMKVAKHGGRRVTSLSGSTDVLETLGIRLATNPKACISDLDTLGYTYLAAPVFNSLLKSFSHLRQTIGKPTIFNILGPLLNPICPQHQVIGVSRKTLLPVMTQILRMSAIKHAIIVHSDDGLDELSISAPSQVIEVRDGFSQEYRIDPESLGLKSAPLQAVSGGNPYQNAEIIRAILSGNLTGAKLDIVLLNSAAGLLVSGKVTSFKMGIEMSRDAIASGRTAHFLATLQTLSTSGEKHA